MALFKGLLIIVLDVNYISRESIKFFLAKWDLQKNN